MEKFQPFDPTPLDSAGLNRQAVIDIDDLPADLAASLAAGCASVPSHRQLILIAHAGRKLWEFLKRSRINSENPIDDFTVQTVKRWFAECMPQNAYAIIHPGEHTLNLQRLGELAGWHHPSPLRLGIDPVWGTWYAYRALVLADTAFEPTRPVAGESPCATCSGKTCIASCPASALAGGTLDLGKCIAYRKEAGSKCRTTCLARVSCPVGSAHRYCGEQIRHTYTISLHAIEKLTAPGLP